MATNPNAIMDLQHVYSVIRDKYASIVPDRFDEFHTYIKRILDPIIPEQSKLQPFFTTASSGLSTNRNQTLYLYDMMWYFIMQEISIEDIDSRKITLNVMEEKHISQYRTQRYDHLCYADFINSAELNDINYAQVDMLSDLTENYMDYTNYQTEIHDKLNGVDVN